LLPLCGLALVIVVDLIRPILAARGGAAGG
jgi:hypothetical protein